MNKLCLFYGSLKSTGYNFNRFFGQKLLKDITLQGYDLYSLGQYPAACKGQGSIKVELHEIEEDTYESIQSMERGAGYEESFIELDGVKASIFLMNPEHLEGRSKVENGDWKCPYGNKRK